MPEVLRPLYESSKVVAQKITIAVSTDVWNEVMSFPSCTLTGKYIRLIEAVAILKINVT